MPTEYAACSVYGYTIESRATILNGYAVDGYVLITVDNDTAYFKRDF